MRPAGLFELVFVTVACDVFEMSFVSKEYFSTRFWIDRLIDRIAEV